MSGFQVIACAALAVLTLAMVASLARLFAGPTLHDRLLATNAMGVQAALVVAALAVFSGQSAWIDAGFALLLGVAVTSIAVLKFVRAHSFQPLLGDASEISS